jgi:hypothetical protein
MRWSCELAWRRARTAVSCSFVDAVNSPRHMERLEDQRKKIRTDVVAGGRRKLVVCRYKSHRIPSNPGKRGAQPSRGLKIRN